MTQQERTEIQNLYDNNAFGEIEDWIDLSEEELVEECQTMLNFWRTELKWDCADVTPQGMAAYLKERWVE